MSIFSSSSKDTQPETTAQSTPAPRTSSTTSPTPTSSLGRNTTTIAQGTQVDGNVKIEGNIQIDGRIKGTLTSKGKVVIGTDGVVEGDVLCQHAEISGNVNGKLKIADILFLKSSARIDGDIQTGKLVMESGVQFNGNCSMGSAATVPSQTAAKSSSSSSSSSNTGSSSGTSASSGASVTASTSNNGQG